MRLAYVSDLHTDLSARNAAFLDALVRRARVVQPDVFLVAGDLAETCRDVAASLARLAAIPALRLYLAGNHDLFVEGGAVTAPTSQDKFERLLPAVATAAGFGYLGLDPVWSGDVAFVGVPGWYDFTLRDPSLDSVADTHVYRTGLWRGSRAYDRGHVLWPRGATRTAVPGENPASAGGAWAGDEEIAGIMRERLESQLAMVRGAAAVIVAVHVLPRLDLVQRGMFGDSPFFDAYLGSAALGDCIEAAGNVRIVVSGHLHRVTAQASGRIRYLASPLGDARKSPLDLDALAAERLGVVDL